VVQHSLQYLTTEDLQAMAMYLQTNALATTANTSASPKAAGASMAERGRKVYERHCATCHGERGEGAPGIYPPLSGNRAVLLGDPTNLVQTVLFGGYGPATQGHPRPFGMPPFVLELEDRDIAAVLTHLRMALQPEGRKAGEVTPLQVNRIRAENDR
jgi:mono/diheme cytochrome c family protein